MLAESLKLMLICTQILLRLQKDSLHDTIDYHKVYKVLYSLALEQKNYLIESVAIKIADELLIKFTAIEKLL